MIAKSLLSRISTESRKKAISELQSTANDNIKQIRGQKATYVNGQGHGFWMQQFANTSLFLSV
jgi:hypothetical protein